MRTTYLKIYQDALRHNLRAIRALVPKETETVAVVKANAYGYGAMLVAGMAMEEGYEALAVAVTGEARQLREAGFKCPIYLLGLLMPDEYEDAFETDAIIPICESTNLKLLDETAAHFGKTASVMVAVDSGMNRIGVQAEDVPEFLEAIKKYTNITVHGFFTHYACADGESHEHVKHQMYRFESMVRRIPNPERYIFTAANSSTTLYFPESYYDAVRPGQIIYGYMPDGHADTQAREDMLPEFESCLGLFSRIVHIHKVKAGDTVGYGATYKCDEDTWIGTVPIGYADGYPRCLSNRGEVLIGGRRYKVAGRVCMDQVMIELGHETDVKVGDEVVLIGRQGGDEITVSDIARLADTHPDEISCQLTQRIPRIYCNKY